MTFFRSWIGIMAAAQENFERDLGLLLTHAAKTAKY